MQLTLINTPFFLLTLTLLTSIVAFSLLWLVCLRLRDCTWADSYWGAGFVVIAACYALILPSITAQQLIFGLCVGLWGMRLSWHLTSRHFGKTEDPRYHAMRTYNGDAFWWKSYFKVFLLQAVLQWLLALPIHLTFLSAQTASSILFLSIGVVIFAIGFFIEIIADYQLNAFRKHLDNRGKILDKGLFSFSRHPNYAGEITLWVGVALMSYAITGTFWGFITPALIAILLIKVSGVALVEAHMLLKYPEYAKYREKVPMIFPTLFAINKTTNKQPR